MNSRRQVAGEAVDINGKFCRVKRRDTLAQETDDDSCEDVPCSPACHAGISRGIELLGRSPAPERTLQVPIIGQISAGEPIPVPLPDVWVTTASETLEVTEALTQGRQGVYALRVKGSSMVDALINDGDIVLMQYLNAVENGEMAAVWLKTEREVTLKKVYYESGRIRLQPANSQMAPIYTETDNLEIQGRVIAVIRQLA